MTALAPSLFRAASLPGRVSVAVSESLAMVTPLGAMLLLGGVGMMPTLPSVGCPHGESRASVGVTMTTSKDVVSLVGDIASKDPSAATAAGVCFFRVAIGWLVVVRVAWRQSMVATHELASWLAVGCGD